ncbi:substrate-binding domain-containing protein [Flavobacterium pectinovorum]|uniref:LacI family transcriptional regulator n=1 Tax=Flavobacterium pectinovorum TaxID=29533 RepID=A0AB36NUJ3_9FLAO|nr:substrate-binding domain-containing protein [Flavobacterium pectinovorum]OXA99192.1 LacI family transcriptional regulator [Flavobacterium pectinovorum]SHN21424.1 transcriptional regulator, LacI family [Flavobacterium pectinovorum]
MIIITIKKIAELANVSPGTVDRIIHNRGQVTQDNVDKVNAIIEQYGYKRNILASNLALNKKFRFAVFLPKYENIEYWKSQISGIEKAAIEFGKFGVVLDYFFYDFNEVSFKKTVEKVLDFDCNGLLFAPIFYEESVRFLNEYEKKNIPVVMIDSNISNNEEHVYVGQDAFQSGYLAGRLISFAVNNERQVLIFKITREIESTSVYLQRIDGFYSFFKDHTELTNFKFSEVTIKDTGIDQLSLEIFSGINSVFVPNSRAYIVARFLEQNNIKGVRIIGYDLLKENIEYLNKGIIDFLINQRPEEQGYMGVNYLYKKLVLQETVENTNYIPLEIILKENYFPAKK